MNRVRRRVVSLEERPDLIDTVAHWVHNEWGVQRGRSYAATRSRFSERSSYARVPQSRVTLIGEEPAGIATLRENDSIDYLPGATPWLCNVFVAPAFRGAGVASALCRSLEDAAFRLGFDRIFLATDVAEDSLYHGLGYRQVSTYAEHDHEVYVLRKDLSR